MTPKKSTAKLFNDLPKDIRTKKNQYKKNFKYFLEEEEEKNINYP